MNIIIDDIDSTVDRKVILGFCDNSGTPFEQIKLEVTTDSIRCLNSTSIPTRQAEEYLELYSNVFNYAKGIQAQLRGETEEPVSVFINSDRGSTHFHSLASFVDNVRLNNPGISDKDIEMVMNYDLSDHEDVNYVVHNQINAKAEAEAAAREKEAREREMLKKLKEKYPE